MILVRYATQDDVEFVSQDGYLHSDVIKRKIQIREVILAERRSAPLGYLRLEYLWSKVPYIAVVRVLPQVRGEGVGRALLRFLEDELYDAGHRVLLSSSQADEPDSEAWHRHMGFVECGRIEGINAGGVDEVFLRKHLQVSTR